MKPKKSQRTKSRLSVRGVHLLSFLLIFSCSSATKYQKNKKGEGYSDSRKGDLHFTEFRANSYTKLADAMTMAQYRGIEVCDPLHSYFLGSEDFSEVKKVTKTSGTYPFYNTGYYPYRRGWSLGVGFGTYSSESWQDKQVYPRIHLTYLCGKNFYAPIGEFKSVSAKELSYIYKDLLGAIMVVETEGNLSLKRGDIILKMNGKRIERLVEFYYAFQNKHTQNLDILRDGKRINVDVQAQEITNKVVKFNQNVIEQMCKLDKKECRRKD